MMNRMKVFTVFTIFLIFSVCIAATKESETELSGLKVCRRGSTANDAAEWPLFGPSGEVDRNLGALDLWDCDTDEDYCEVDEEAAKKPDVNPYPYAIAFTAGVPVIFAAFLMLCFPLFCVGRYICCCPKSSRGCFGGTNPSKKTKCCPLGYSPKGKLNPKTKKIDFKYSKCGRFCAHAMMIMFIVSVAYGMNTAYENASLSESATSISDNVPLPFAKLAVDLQKPIKTVLVDVVSKTVVGGVTNVKDLLDRRIDVTSAVDAVKGLVDVVGDLANINLDYVTEALQYVTDTVALLPDADTINQMKTLVDDLGDLFAYVDTLAGQLDTLSTIITDWDPIYKSLANPLTDPAPGVIPKLEYIIQYFQDQFDSSVDESLAKHIDGLKTSVQYIADNVANFSLGGSAIGAGAAAVTIRSDMRVTLEACSTHITAINTLSADISDYLKEPADAKKMDISGHQVTVLGTIDEMMTALNNVQIKLVDAQPTYTDFHTAFAGVEDIVKNKVGSVDPYITLVTNFKTVVDNPFDTTNLFAVVDRISALDNQELYDDMDTLSGVLTNVDTYLVSLPEEVQDIQDQIADGKTKIKDAVGQVSEVKTSFGKVDDMLASISSSELQDYITNLQSLEDQKTDIESIDFAGIDANVKSVLDQDTSFLADLYNSDAGTGKLVDLRSQMFTAGSDFVIDLSTAQTKINDAYTAFKQFSGGICDTGTIVFCYDSVDNVSPDGYQFSTTDPCSGNTCHNVKSGQGYCSLSLSNFCATDADCSAGGHGTCQIPDLSSKSSEVSSQMSALDDASAAMTSLVGDLAVGADISSAKSSLDSINSSMGSMDISSMKGTIDTFKDVDLPDMEGFKSSLTDLGNASADVQSVSDEMSTINDAVNEFADLRDEIVDQIGTVETRTEGAEDLIKNKIDDWTSRLGETIVSKTMEEEGIAGVMLLMQDVAEEAYDFINEKLLDEGPSAYSFDEEVEMNDVPLIPRIRDMFTVLGAYKTSANISKPLDLLVDLFNALNYGVTDGSSTTEASDLFDVGIHLVTRNDGTVYKDADHVKYGDDVYCVSNECVKNTAEMIWDQPIQDSLDEFDVDDVTADGVPAAKTLMLTQFIFPVLIALCGGVSMMVKFIGKKCGCLPSCCTMFCICLYLPVLLIIVGGVFWPATMVLADVCASGEDLIHVQVSAKAQVICEDQLSSIGDDATWDVSTGKCRITKDLVDGRIMDVELDLVEIFDNVVGSCETSRIDGTVDSSKDVFKPVWDAIDAAMASYPKDQIDEQIADLDDYTIRSELLDVITDTTSNLSTDISTLIGDFSDVADCEHINDFYVTLKDTICCDFFTIWYHIVFAWVIIMWGMCLCGCCGSILGQKRFQSKISPKIKIVPQRKIAQKGVAPAAATPMKPDSAPMNSGNPGNPQVIQVQQTGPIAVQQQQFQQNLNPSFQPQPVFQPQQQQSFMQPGTYAQVQVQQVPVMNPQPIMNPESQQIQLNQPQMQMM
eukprot:TRINITY_DN47_c0_g1_i5.p1 TRINITY_DN47_c0_g1~~TRINITY_DN47_c0_g1_i5.p1  ORF type:complete len:1481 (-),score=563.40 TRINITY_DN47_c0_g1_i5:456-4898(-)